MNLHWSSLAEVAVVSVGATVGIVIIFTMGVRALASRARTGGRSGGTISVLTMAVAGLCFLVCAAAVVYGLYLIVPQFH